MLSQNEVVGGLLIQLMLVKYLLYQGRDLSSVGFSGTPNNGTPYPYYSHTTPIIGMGIVWEAYHKGVPLLGVPGITLDSGGRQMKRKMPCEI